jgi:hypothetical protein
MGERIGETYLSFQTPKKNLSSSLHRSLLDKFQLTPSKQTTIALENSSKAQCIFSFHMRKDHGPALEPSTTSMQSPVLAL